MKSLTKNDLLYLMGLSFTGTGLFFWFGIGPALSAIGFALLLMGAFGTYDEVKK